MVRRSSDFCNAKIDCGVSNERFFREPHQRSKKCEMQSTHPRTYRFNQFHLFDGLFMFGARADNRTAFCAAKTWFAEAAATARSRCGLRSREYTKFSVKRPRRSENSGTHRTHPRRLHLSDIRKDVCLCLGRERIIEPLFHCERKFIFPRQHPDESKTYVKNRVLLLKNI